MPEYNAWSNTWEKLEIILEIWPANAIEAILSDNLKESKVRVEG